MKSGKNSSVNTTKSSKGNLKWLLSVAEPHRGRIVVQILLESVISLSSLIITWVLKELIDAATSKYSFYFWRWAAVLISIVLFEIVCDNLSQYLRGITTSKIALSLRQRLFDNLLNRDFTEVRSKHSAEWLNRITHDTNTVSKALSTLLPQFIGVVVRLTGAIIILLRVVPWFLSLLVIGIAIIALFGYFIKEPTKKRQNAVREADGEQQSYIIEHLSRLMIIKAFNREELISENSERIGEQLYEQQRRRTLLSALTGFCKTVGFRGVYFIAIIYGTYLILIGRISYGTYTMIVRLVTVIRGPLINAGSYLTSYYDVSVSIERLKEAESFSEDPNIPVKNDDVIQRFYEAEFKEITLANVGFVYNDNQSAEYSNPIVFSNVSINIPKQSCIAITGITGSGKSTLFKILMNLYPINDGKCIIKTNSEKELMLDASFRRLFAYVPQGNQLMSGSIREIVTFGNSSDFGKTAEIREALELACALSFVDELPDGLDTVLKEKGLGLSEGQMQRLAVARAIFTNRPILLLDEATSSLDEMTEEQLLANLKNMSDKTILIVTHRPAALSICDYEIHIDGGNVDMHKL